MFSRLKLAAAMNKQRKIITINTEDTEPPVLVYETPCKKILTLKRDPNVRDIQIRGSEFELYTKEKNHD